MICNASACPSTIRPSTIANVSGTGGRDRDLITASVRDRCEKDMIDGEGTRFDLKGLAGSTELLMPELRDFVPHSKIWSARE